MCRIFTFLLAIATVLFVGTYGQQCGYNMKYYECGSSCEPSCANPTPQACIYQCVGGCHCIPGFLRNVVGRCVHPLNC